MVVMQLWWLVVISVVFLISFTVVVFGLWWLVMIVNGCYGFLWVVFYAILMGVYIISIGDVLK